MSATNPAAPADPVAGLLANVTTADAMLARLLTDTLATESAVYLQALIEARAIRHRTDQVRNRAIPATPHVRYHGALIDPDTIHEPLADAECRFAGTVQCIAEWCRQARDGVKSDEAAALFDAIESDARRLKVDFAIITPEDREDRLHAV